MKLTIPNPVEIAPRAMTPARRARIFTAHAGICGVCGTKIMPDQPWIADHRIPLEISGDDSDDNLQPIHAAPCNKVKTAKDQADIAKARRRRLKHTGEFPRSKTVIRSRGFQRTRPEA